MKAALLIQRWYRRYCARLEARRRATWSIFQSLEYAGEQDQLRLYNFFNDFIVHLKLAPGLPPGGVTADGEGPEGAGLLSLLKPYGVRRSASVEALDEEDAELYQVTDPAKVKLSTSYKGPVLEFPLNQKQIGGLIDAFKRKQLLHARYLLQLLHETRRVLKNQSNVVQASTSLSKQITVIGDLHGKLDDLFIIFYKNGLPTTTNPYIFNGDFVDRGSHSVEIAALLFAHLVYNPSSVIINRGNHEDHVMNLRYGFIKEVMNKYKDNATKVVRLFEDVFSWLPLATVIDQKVLVAHGGLSDCTDLQYMNTIDRHRYLSALRPPLLEDEDAGSDGEGEEDENNIDLREWRQVLDILWSDPKPHRGCTPNTFRGGGSYFGPDITKTVLRNHNLKLLVRSHECKPEGYEYTHDGQVLTIFSASNYYEVGSNKGAYVKFGPDHEPHIVQYMASKGHAGRKLTIKQRVRLVEDSALKSLREKVLSNRSQLLAEFQKFDNTNSGVIKLQEWCIALNSVVGLDLPWRSLRPKLARCTDNGHVIYQSTFEEFSIKHKNAEVPPGEKRESNVTETLYRNKEILETIFRAIDKDNSGLISMEEFEDAVSLVSKHSGAMLDKTQIREMAQSIDINKDGSIDFNEFLEAFRIVDNVGREILRNRGPDASLTPKSMNGQIDDINSVS